MGRQLRAYAVRVAESGAITFLASRADVEGRDGLVIEAGAWDTTDYEKNPVVLDSHKYGEPAIGRTVRLQKTDAGLVADVVFDDEDPRAKLIHGKYVRKIMNAVSVGWETKRQEGNRVKQAMLLDISTVSVPGDPGALAIARQRYSALGEAEPLDVAAALRTMTEAEAERLLRRLHEEIVIKPQAHERLQRLIREAVEEKMR